VSVLSAGFVAGPGLANELLDEPTRDLGCEQRLAGRDITDGADELAWRHGFEQKAAGALFHGTVHVLVEVKCREHQDATRAVGSFE